jgi:hypothetical protein
MEEQLQFGSYLYPMNIPNIDILKEYIERISPDSAIDTMPVDVECLIKEGRVVCIDMNSRKGQSKYRQIIQKKLIRSIS